MDKPKNGNTIKIKLNGEDQSFEETPKKVETEASTPSYPKVIKINSNLVDENTQSETAAAQESIEDESFDWIIPESSNDKIEEFTIANQKQPKKASLPKIAAFSTNTKIKNGRSLASILLSAAFAVLVGTTIGFVMLKLVITGPNDKPATEISPTVSGPNTIEENGASSGKTTAGTISQLTAYVIQGGVYSSKEGASSTSKQLANLGVPSQLVEMDGKQFLFLGVADSIQTAKSLGAQYKANGVQDVFAKPLLVDEKKFSDTTEKEASFLTNVPAIYQALSEATSSGLLANSISEESNKALTKIESQLNVSGIKNKDVKKLKDELMNAEEKVKSYQKSKETKNLTQAQQHLLNFLSIYFSI